MRETRWFIPVGNDEGCAAVGSPNHRDRLGTDRTNRWSPSSDTCYKLSLSLKGSVPTFPGSYVPRGPMFPGPM